MKVALEIETGGGIEGRVWEAAIRTAMMRGLSDLVAKGTAGGKELQLSGGFGEPLYLSAADGGK